VPKYNVMKRLILENKDGVVEQIHDYLENNAEAKFIHRLQVILMFANKEDESCDSLGALFGNSPRSISTWIKKVNQTGSIASLRSKSPSGRPTRLTKVQKDELKYVFQELPEKWGLQANTWGGKNLSSYISQHYGIALEVRSCQRLIRKLRMSIKTSK
jgi:transposase